MIKTLITVFVLTVCTQNVHAQDTLSLAPKKKYKNELGLDVTPFIKFYTDISGNGFNYQPNYYLTYRHLFKKSNIRAAIGGRYYFNESTSPYDDDLNESYEQEEEYIEFRLGYEFFQDLSKRWQVYYGLDARAGNRHYRVEAESFNGGYAQGRETTTESLGVSPLLGIRFKINPRLSILTESNLLLQYSTMTVTRFYTPIYILYPPMENEPDVKSKSVGASFTYPISVVLTFNL